VRRVGLQRLVTELIDDQASPPCVR
jgi:hypothetical protein